MGTATFHPTWWQEEKHGSAWERAKEALKRDWEQTKNDFRAGGKDLDQDVDDTVKQAAGKQAIPPSNVPNAPSTKNTKGAEYSWNEVEHPMAYGYGARDQYGKQYAQWDDRLESTLRSEWEQAKDNTGRRWDDVKSFVRRGYESKRT